MAISKQLRKDFIKHLGVIPDKRRKDYKDLIKKHGGEDKAIEALKARLNKVPAYNKQLTVRNTAKKPLERRRKKNDISVILKLFIMFGKQRRDLMN